MKPCLKILPLNERRLATITARFLGRNESEALQLKTLPIDRGARSHNPLYQPQPRF